VMGMRSIANMITSHQLSAVSHQVNQLGCRALLE
jgi:hypothetical protein